MTTPTDSLRHEPGPDDGRVSSTNADQTASSHRVGHQRSHTDDGLPEGQRSSTGTDESAAGAQPVPHLYEDDGRTFLAARRRPTAAYGWRKVIANITGGRINPGPSAEQQHAAYPDIEPDDTTATPQDTYAAVMKVITKRKWRVVDSRPPQGPLPRVLDTRASQAGTVRDGIIEAVARTPILGFRDDVVVRIRPTIDGARIDIRSASRYGRHDLGTNAKRVRGLIDDIDDVLSTPQPEKKTAVGCLAKAPHSRLESKFPDPISLTQSIP